MQRQYRPEVITHNLPRAMPTGTMRYLHIQLRNTSGQDWHRRAPCGNPPRLLLTVDRTVVGRATLSSPNVVVGDEATFSFRWRSPDQPGTIPVGLELVEPGLPFLSPGSVQLLCAELELHLPNNSRSEALMHSAFQHNPWFWLPSEGIHWSASGGRYPLFVISAAGARCRDAEGREFVDYVCGWGSCLLGYADARVTAAIAESLRETAITTLPSVREVQLAEALCARFPGAEMVIFGKNGSDVCTAAVRLARAFTGRTVILHSGYHGWQDWCVEPRGFAHTSVPERERRLVYRFPSDDLNTLSALLEANRGRVAAVMLEPAVQIGGIEGPIPDADPGFLRAVSKQTRRAGALLVFDEIFTGFRYPGGSVQNAVGLRPDLTCLGKALGAGMPLAALIGRRDVFESGMHRIAYDATFKGEPHSFAAALRALSIYDEADIPGRVAAFGRRLIDGIEERIVRHGIPARVVGTPIRLTLSYPDRRDAVFLRTFVQQQLLLHGVLTFRGVMMPSAAHNDADLAWTLSAYDATFTALRNALQRNAVLENLEIPLIQ
jgi:glutamate-1-semialdehyde 2,1-aminomutase